MQTFQNAIEAALAISQMAAAVPAPKLALTQDDITAEPSVGLIRQSLKAAERAAWLAIAEAAVRASFSDWQSDDAREALSGLQSQSISYLQAVACEFVGVSL